MFQHTPRLSHMLKRTSQRGYSLIEMMISITLGLFILSGSIVVLVNTMHSSHEALKLMRLSYDMQTAMNLIVDDLRRAGYWSQAINDVESGANTNPFMQAGTDISINNSNTCVLFTYDDDKSGTLPALNNAGGDKRYGYRLSGQTIQMRPLGADFSCTASADSWEPLTDNLITNFSINETDTVVPVDGTTSTVTIRYITVTMTAQLDTDPVITRTLTQTVRVRNDKLTV